jgi:hypothetical protein
MLPRLLTLLLIAVLLPAQPPRRGPRPDESFAERRVYDLARRFELSDAQRRQTLVIFNEADRNAEPIEDRIEKTRRELRDAAIRNASSAEIDQIAARLGEAIGQLEAIEARALAAFYSTLSDKQRELIPRSTRGHRGPPPPRD